MFILVNKTISEDLIYKVFDIVRRRGSLPLGVYDIDTDTLTRRIIHESEYIFIFIEDNDGCRLNIDFRYNPSLDRKYETDSCLNAIYCIYDYLIDIFYKQNRSKEQISEIKYILSFLIRDALILTNIVYTPTEDEVAHLIEEIVKEMLKITTYYNKFESPLVEVTKAPDNSLLHTEKIIIKFYNGNEENYNPTFTIEPTHFDKEYLKMIVKVLDPDSKDDIGDPSCGFYLLLLSIIKATAFDLNKILLKAGFRDFFPINDTDDAFLFTNKYKSPLDLKQVARECVLKGIINYIWKYIPHQWPKGKEYWNWIFGDYKTDFLSN